MTKTKKTRFYVIEDDNNGSFASHGYYSTEAEAKKEAERLQSFYPSCTFFVEPSQFGEPSFINL